MSGWVRCLAIDALAHKLIFRRGPRAWLALSVRPRGGNIRRRSVPVPRHLGAWIAKWLFVVAALTMPIVFGQRAVTRRTSPFAAVASGDPRGRRRHEGGHHQHSRQRPHQES